MKKKATAVDPQVKGIQEAASYHKAIKGRVPSFKSLKLPRTSPPRGRIIPFRPLQYVLQHPVQISAAAAVLLLVFSTWFFTTLVTPLPARLQPCWPVYLSPTLWTWP